MLIGGILAAVVVVGIVAAALVRSRAQDDEHSVEHYHRQLHTLEEIRTHPAPGTLSEEEVDVDTETNGKAGYPASAFKVSGSSSVRLTEPGHVIVPPTPPPPVPNPAEPVKFDDASSSAEPASSPQAFMSGHEDRVMQSINHRPRRLGGPIAAVSAVTVLIVVLIVTGLHSSNAPKHHGGSSTATTVTTLGPAHRHGHSNPASHQTTTTVPPVVSVPQSTNGHAATYQVAGSTYSLALSATKGECWVEATSTGSGSVLFTGTLFSGQSQTVAASGPVTVIAGAPAAFVATVNGSPVTLPPGSLAPFTLSFQPATTG